MSSVLTPTEQELRHERAELIRHSHLSEPELRRRAKTFLLSPEDARTFRRIQEIDFLLDGDS